MRIRHDIIRQQVIDRDKQIEKLKNDINLLMHSFKFTETFLNGEIKRLEAEKKCCLCKSKDEVIASLLLQRIVSKKKWWQFWTKG